MQAVVYENTCESLLSVRVINCNTLQQKEIRFTRIELILVVDN